MAMSKTDVAFVTAKALACIIAAAGAGAEAAQAIPPEGSYAPGQLTLQGGESIQANGHQLLMRADCDLVLSDDSGKVLWTSNTQSAAPGKSCRSPVLSYRSDGVLVIEASVNGAAPGPVWSVNTRGSSALALIAEIPYLEVLNPDQSLGWSPSNALASFSQTLAAQTGFGDPSYSTHVPAASPVAAAEGDLVDRSIAANQRAVTVVVKAPVVDRVYPVAPIGKGETPINYFANAVAAAGSNATVVFPKGQVYEFGAIDCVSGSDPKYTPAYWQINGATDLVIDGNGSTLNFASPCQGIVLNSAQRVVLRNFVIDWPRLRVAAVGTITATGGNGTTGYTYSLQLDREYVTPGAPKQIAAVTAWDSAKGYWSLDNPLEDVSYGAGYIPALSSAGSVSDVTSYGVAFAKGRRVLVRYYFPSGGPAVTLASGADVTFQGLTIYSSPQTGFYMAQGRGMRIDHCTITRSSGRPISLSADAVHISGAVGGDIIVENSSFAYQGDDGFNINTPLIGVGASAGTDQISVPNWFTPQVGDPIALFGPELAFLAKDYPSLVTSVNTNSDGTNTLGLSTSIPAAAAGGYLADLATPSARYIIRHNQYLHNRARGVLLQSAYGLVQNNTFVGQTLFPIYMVSSTFWGEGAGAQNLLVVGNHVSQPGRGGGLAAVVLTREDSASNPVYVSRAAPGRFPPTPAIHQNIIFAGNLIEHTPGAGFYISSANNVVLYRNTLFDTVRSPVPNVINSAPVIDVPVVINDASNILVEGNTFPGWNTGADPVAVDANTTSSVAVDRR
jgi:Right handed beta helix region